MFHTQNMHENKMFSVKFEGGSMRKAYWQYCFLISGPYQGQYQAGPPFGPEQQQPYGPQHPGQYPPTQNQYPNNRQMYPPYGPEDP
jgi:hypothetical protein